MEKTNIPPVIAISSLWNFLNLSGLSKTLIKLDKRSWNIKKNKLKNIYKYGLKNCLIREGIYTTCLFTVTPRLEHFINKDFSYGNIISPVISGITATFLSHPFDTIKTNQQKNYHNIIKDKKISLRNSYKGFGCRSFRITTTYFILNETNKFFIKNYF